jgi:hypothetical protein
MRRGGMADRTSEEGGSRKGDDGEVMRGVTGEEPTSGWGSRRAISADAAREGHRGMRRMGNR